MDDPLTFLDLTRPMGREIAAHDWGSTPLGPIAAWPAVLKSTVGTVIRSGFPKCLCWGPDMTAIYNEPFKAILGAKTAPLGKPFYEIWHEAWAEIGPIAARALAGESIYIEDFPLKVIRRGTVPRAAWFTFSYSPVVDECGRVCGFMDTVIETTGKVRFERDAEIRNRELVHRMKNSYAMISAIVSQTFRSAATKEEVRAKLLPRLHAMGNAQNALTLGLNSGADVAKLVDSAVRQFGTHEGQFSIAGPMVHLNGEQASALALAINELGTNATKYGALSTDAGHVAIRWAQGPDGFAFTWTESAGPEVVPPEKQGFGSFLIRQALAAEFDGVVDVSFARDGLVCRLSGHL